MIKDIHKKIIDFLILFIFLAGLLIILVSIYTFLFPVRYPYDTYSPSFVYRLTMLGVSLLATCVAMSLPIIGLSFLREYEKKNKKTV